MDSSNPSSSSLSGFNFSGISNDSASRNGEDDLFSAYVATFQPTFIRHSDLEVPDDGFVDDYGPDGDYEEDGNTEYHDAVGPDGDTEGLPSPPAVTMPQPKRRDLRERITSAHTDIAREFMHIVIKAGPDLYDTPKLLKRESHYGEEKMVFSSTHDGPFRTTWTVHFYPWGHPSGYPMTGPSDDQKSASLYVRLQEAPSDMVEARITATVVSSLEKAEAVVKTSMDNLMLCPRNKIDEFQRGTSGHGWPKISSVKDLRNYKDGFCLVVTLQIVKPDAASFNSSRVFRAKAPVNCSEQPRYLLQRSQEYCDAFLQAKDWQWIKAHRFVLAAGSTFFRRLLEEDQGVPFVYKTNNTFEELRALLDVLYLGRIPARNYVESTKLREMVFPYGVDCARPVFFNDVVQYHKLGGIATAAATVTAISEESLNS